MMIKRAHGWIARALAPALTLATAACLTTAIGGCIDEPVDDDAGEADAVYFSPPDYNECWDPDQDGDGFASFQCGGDDCDDLDPDVYPGHGCIAEEEENEGQGAGCTSKVCCTPANPVCPGEQAP